QLHAERTAEAPEVRQWLRRATSLGSGTGQYLLGMSYLEGDGGPADPLEAYVWLSLALLNGEVQAQSAVSQLAARLSPSQLAIARQRINDGRPGRLPCGIAMGSRKNSIMLVLLQLISLFVA